MKMTILLNFILSLRLKLKKGRGIFLHSFLSFLFALSLLSCGGKDDSNNPHKLDPEGGPGGVPSAATPQDYCVSFKKLVVEGRSRKLYGALCGVTSEDEFILLDEAQITDRLRNCRPFFYERDETPLYSNTFDEDLIGALLAIFAPDMKDKLPPDDLLALYDSGDSEPPLIEKGEHWEGEHWEGEDDGAYATSWTDINWTFRLKDKRNHRVILLALPILSAESTACGNIFWIFPDLRKPIDCVLLPYEGFSSKPGEYPGILQIMDKDFYDNPFVPQEKILVFRESEDDEDSVSFHFEVERGACENESPPAFFPRPEPQSPAPPEGPETPGDSKEPVAVGPPPPPSDDESLGEPYCLLLDTISVDEDGVWDENGRSPDKVELYGKVCAEGNGSEVCLWKEEGDSGTPKIWADRSRSVNTKETLRLENAGDPISLRFYSIYDYDSFGTDRDPDDNSNNNDDLLHPTGSYEGTYPDEAAVFPLSASSLANDGDSLTPSPSVTFQLSNDDADEDIAGGQVHFNFTLTRGVCPVAE